MKVGITGVSGLLGAHLAQALARDHQVVGFDRHRWWGSAPITTSFGDLMDGEFRSRSLSSPEFDVFIHCAAMVNVDQCEERPLDAYRINGELTGYLARALSRRTFFVYVTTDGIFDGERPLRSEDDLPCPRTVYGRSKLHGEWETQLSGLEHLIVRTNFYGWSSGAKPTSAEWLYDALSDGSPVTLFDDFYFSPIYVVDVVKAVVTLLNHRVKGIVNVAGADRLSKLEFGLMMARVGSLDATAISRGSIEKAPLRARRPKDMSLSSSKFTNITGEKPSECEEGLRRFFRDRQRSLEARVSDVPVLTDRGRDGDRTP